jgi:hypothetical protein
MADRRSSATSKKRIGEVGTAVIRGDGDQLLAQAMSLRWDEEHPLKTANRTPPRTAA